MLPEKPGASCPAYQFDNFNGNDKITRHYWLEQNTHVCFYLDDRHGTDKG